MSPDLPAFSLLRNLPEALLVIDPLADQVCYANRGSCRLIEASESAVLAMLPSRLFGKSLPQLVSFSEAVLAQNKGLNEDLILSKANGEFIEVEVTASCLRVDSRCLLGFCLRDKERFHRWRTQVGAQRHHRYGALEWHRIHQVFRNIEKENHLILNAAGEGIYGVDADGSATFVNPAAERILGWREQELIGRNIHGAIHHSHTDGSDYCVSDCPIYAAFKDGAVRRVENEVFWTKDGRPVAVEYTSTPILDNGHLVGAVVIFRDVSDRKDAELKLRKALEEVEQLKAKLELENAYLQEEISESYNYHHIIGKSPAVRQVIHQVELVAPTTATVLITGESGTGKELIARAIHNASERKHRPLVRVNCAAIPRDLFESEFFGHAKGAFSGAIAERLGRFEVADGGSLFLDEVGEIPLELQGKLLRALQNNEFERVGESRTRTVNVRVIAATNRNLKSLVDQGRFREDLYFRLNVFPVHSAPLRERRSDIPLLVGHILKKTCQRFNKPLLRISVGQMQQLQDYHWPGNIRELENVLERQVILSRGEKLELEMVAAKTSHGAGTSGHQSGEPRSDRPASLNNTFLTDAEQKHLQVEAIVAALKQANGRIYGSSGAAALLGIKPTTLASRIKKFGIHKHRASA